MNTVRLLIQEQQCSQDAKVHWWTRLRNHSAGPSTELLGPWHEFFRKAMPPSTSGGKRLRSSPPGYLLCTLQWRYTFGCVSPIWIGRRKEGGYTINMVTVLRRGLQYFPTAAQWPRDNKTGQFLLSVSVRAGRQNPGWTGWFWGLGVFLFVFRGWNRSVLTYNYFF